MSQAKLQVQDVTGALEAIVRNPRSQRTSKDLEELVARLKASQTAIDSADSTLKTSLQQQQQMIEKADPALKRKADEGWMFLGHVDEAKRDWTSVNAKRLDGHDPSLTGTQRLQITEATYLRTGTPAGQHTSGVVQGLLPVGENVDVLAIDSSSHALRGGWFVWARVRRTAAGS